MRYPRIKVVTREVSPVLFIRAGVFLFKKFLGGKIMSISKISVDEQMKIIMKGVDSLIDEKDLKEKLTKAQKEDKPLVIKLGLDPSAPDII